MISNTQIILDLFQILNSLPISRLIQFFTARTLLHFDLTVVKSLMSVSLFFRYCQLMSCLCQVFKDNMYLLDLVVAYSPLVWVDPRQNRTITQHDKHVAFRRQSDGSMARSLVHVSEWVTMLTCWLTNPLKSGSLSRTDYHKIGRLRLIKRFLSKNA